MDPCCFQQQTRYNTTTFNGPTWEIPVLRRLSDTTSTESGAAWADSDKMVDVLL